MYHFGAFTLIFYHFGGLIHERTVFCLSKDGSFNDICSLSERVIYLRYDICLRHIRERILYQCYMGQGDGFLVSFRLVSI